MLAVEAVDAAPTIQLQSRSSDAFHSPHATHGELGDSRQDLSKGGSSKLEAQELRRQTFASLQPLCSVLLEHRKDPEELSQVLAGKNAHPRTMTARLCTIGYVGYLISMLQETLCEACANVCIKICLNAFCGHVQDWRFL